MEALMLALVGKVLAFILIIVVLAFIGLVAIIRKIL